MMFNSLLWLEDSKSMTVDEDVIKDLNLIELFKRLIALEGGNQSIITTMCLDLKTIHYRQGIVSDFTHSPALLQELVEDLEAFEKLHLLFRKKDYKASNLYFLISLVRIVETSILCLDKLHETLHYYKIQSEGLVALRHIIDEFIKAAEFKQMKQDLSKIQYAFSQVKSAEISVNMSTGMRPFEAQVTEVNDHKYRYPLAFRQVALALENSNDFLGKQLKNYAPVFSIDNLDWDLLDEIEYGLRDHKETLKSFLDKYKKIDSTPYISLLKEVIFYQSSLKVLNELKDLGFPLTMPELKDKELREMKAEGVYNLHLGFKMLKAKKEHLEVEEMVLNDFEMSQEKRIFILTGANRGGKTTFTQCLGQIQMLAQLGLPVPAQKVTLSIVDSLFTHFPILEKDTVDLGRFGKECQMFKAQYDRASSYSLMLLNESFAGTSHLESLLIAKEVVKAIKYKRIRCVFNTHLHELARETRQFNETLSNDTRIISIVAGDEAAINSYIIKEKEAAGLSHAMEIARRYGVTFEQLMRRLQRNSQIQGQELSEEVLHDEA
jgi:DNA mismatch repair protein MutS